MVRTVWLFVLAVVHASAHGVVLLGEPGAPCEPAACAGGTFDASGRFYVRAGCEAGDVSCRVGTPLTVHEAAEVGTRALLPPVIVTKTRATMEWEDSTGQTSDTTEGPEGALALPPPTTLAHKKRDWRIESVDGHVFISREVPDNTPDAPNPVL